MKCLICRLPAERHHIKTRGSGGSDDEWNILFICRIHHIECHKIGTSTFAEKYIQVKLWLLSHNWEFNEVLNKWRKK